MATATQTAGRSHHRIRLRTYLDYRLGRDQPWWRQTYNVLVQPLAAPSLAEFWRTWNPVWSYYLAAWCYRPVRRVLPHAAAVMVTFTASDRSAPQLNGSAAPRAGRTGPAAGAGRRRLVFFHFANCGTFTPSFVGPWWGTWQDFLPSGGEVVGD